jgi:hypothetical protein
MASFEIEHLAVRPERRRRAPIEFSHSLSLSVTRPRTATEQTTHFENLIAGAGKTNFVLGIEPSAAERDGASHKIPIAHIVDFFEVFDRLGIMARHDDGFAVLLRQ